MMPSLPYADLLLRVGQLISQLTPSSKHSQLLSLRKCLLAQVANAVARMLSYFAPLVTVLIVRQLY
jgi:hypothetical protein